MSNFEYVDRRREKLHIAGSIPGEENTISGEGVSNWEDVAYVIGLLPQQNGAMIVMGRAVGLRDDGLSFVADYWFSQSWKPGFDWTVEALKRLDTFLGCSCSTRCPCSVHKVYLQQWIKADHQRLMLAMSAPPPKALEAYLRAEMAAQESKIEIPR